MDPWQPIDELIVKRRILPAMQAIREAEGCSLQRAIEVFDERCELLRRTRPDAFAVTREERGQGVHT
ncbi:hypothetical protein [Micromonospora sp. NPDC048830]|uniref:hypothetical protein n=1 Tax=Micromonospora sp. NPDC048830 TaxID=3364257 RepID=UPI003720F087